MESMYLRGQYFTSTHFLCKEDSFVKNNSNSWNSSQTCTSLPHEIVCSGIISTIHIYIIPLTRETQTFPQKSRVILCLHYSAWNNRGFTQPSFLFPQFPSSLKLCLPCQLNITCICSFLGGQTGASQLFLLATYLLISPWVHIPSHTLIHSSNP